MATIPKEYLTQEFDFGFTTGEEFVAAEEVNTWAGSKLTRGLQQGYARKMMRNRAARPPGTLGPNNTGGELYKLWQSKAANRWPKTRKTRKSRRRRNQLAMTNIYVGTEPIIYRL